MKEHASIGIPHSRAKLNSTRVLKSKKRALQSFLSRLILAIMAHKEMLLYDMEYHEQRQSNAPTISVRQR